MSSRALGARPVAARGLPTLPATPPAAGRPARPWLVVAEPHACTHVRTHTHTHQQRASVAGRCPPSPGPRVGVTLCVVLSDAHSPPLVRLLLGPPHHHRQDAYCSQYTHTPISSDINSQKSHVARSMFFSCARSGFLGVQGTAGS